MANFSHPCAAVSHVFFKTAAVLTYILCEWFSDNFVVNFVVLATLLACDFWTVKNVSGRFLVGLRWWHEVNEDGSSQWKFESLDEEGQKTIDTFEKRIFWWSTYAVPVIWVLLGLVTLLRLHWTYLIIVLLALVLACSNLVGYVKASRDQTKQISDMLGTAKAFSVIKNLV
ncbi:DUF846 domain-containing protein [Chloropicon primus]|uniref:Golgi apparatus membrane protein TVP23 n=1 Tax=Chloropicon primus TaxID=1764295 RepID=A0A5B8MLZ7_9CHLO|nr:DUF846 domain-containing protein [Chloropicon primus]UPR00255.1 DUF846 domain-containing protein [Chloropicon primus]|eukprot:QDZ21044.1 DUF846 domain-containing protein [Chloropicon primus]